MQLPGLRLDHFDCYREPKGRSNMFNKARLEVKQWLLSISGALAARLGDLDSEIEVLASDHHPSLWNRKVVDRQWVFFSRGKRQRADLERLVDTGRSLASTLGDPTPYFKHAHLCLCVSGDGFEIATKLHHSAWVDRDNLIARLADPEERSWFLGTLAELPEEYVFGVDGGPLVRAQAVDEGQLCAALDRFVSDKGMLTVGIKVDPARAVELGQDIVEVASVAFLLMVPVYEAFTWREDQDWIALADRERDLDQGRRAITAARVAGEEAFEAMQRERHEEQSRRFEEQRAEKIAQQSFREAAAHRERIRRTAQEDQLRREEQIERERRSEAAAGIAARAEDAAVPDRSVAGTVEHLPPGEADGPAGAAPVDPPVPAAAARIAPPAVEPRQPLAARGDGRPADERRPSRRARRERLPQGPFAVAPGVRVEISTGVLEGKWGIVQDVDRRGQAKVVLGSMVTRVAVSDLRPPGSWRG